MSTMISSAHTAATRTGFRVKVRPSVYLNFPGPPAFMLNLSEQGMAIQSSEPLREGDLLPFACPLPDGDAEVKGVARIVWTDNKGRAGLRFTQLSEFDRYRLKEWLEKTQHAELRAHSAA